MNRSTSVAVLASAASIGKILIRGRSSARSCSSSRRMRTRSPLISSPSSASERRSWARWCRCEASMAAEGLAAKGLIGVAKRYCAVAVGTRHREGEAGERASWAAVDATLSFVSRRSTASVVGTMLDGGSGILVFPRPVVVDRLARILQRPDLRGSHAGIGPVVGSLEEIWASFEKAQRALRVSLSDLNDQNLVVEWESLGLDSLLVLLPLDQLRRSDLPAPLRLLFDARSADVLVRTLDAYLTAGGDAQATARTLMIHRSTLYYRLDRIRELTGSDLRDGRTRRELHTGTRMLNWRDCGVTRHPDAGCRISPQRRASHQGQDRHHPPHSGHGPGTDRVLGPTPDPAPTAGLAMGNGVEHPVRQPVSPTPRSSPDLNAPTAPRTRKTQWNNPTPRSGHDSRPHGGTPRFKAHNRNQLQTDSRSVDPRLSTIPFR